MSISDDKLADLDRRNRDTIARLSIRLEDPPLEVGDPLTREEDLVRECEDCGDPLKEWEEDVCTKCIQLKGGTHHHG